MYDLQKQIDRMSKMFAEERSRYHLTLSQLKTILELAPKEYTVNIDRGGSLERPISYRGYYEDLAFEPSDETMCVKGFLPIVQSCLGKIFEGYKGGNFKMHEKTPLWLAYYGESTNVALMSAITSDNFKAIMISTKEIEL